MTAPSYQLDTNSAREGANVGGQRITETGAYTGVFTKAKHFTNDKGTTGIDFAFESTSGQNAYFQIYTKNNKGESIFGEKQLQAIMACMKLRGINPSQATIEEFNFDSRQVEKVQATVFKELMNTPVGVVLQKEYYTKNSGEAGERMNFFTAFDPKTKQMADEVLDQLQAEKLDKVMATLQDKYSTNNPQTSAPAQNASQNFQQPPASGADDFDDLPF